MLAQPAKNSLLGCGYKVQNLHSPQAPTESSESRQSGRSSVESGSELALRRHSNYANHFVLVVAPTADMNLSRNLYAGRNGRTRCVSVPETLDSLLHSKEQSLSRLVPKPVAPAFSRD